MRLLLSRKCLLFQSKGFGIHPWLSRIFGTSLPVYNDANQMNPLLQMKTVNQDYSRQYILYNKHIKDSSIGTHLGSGATRQFVKESSNTDDPKYNMKHELLKLLGGLGILVGLAYLFVKLLDMPEIQKFRRGILEMQRKCKIPGISVAISLNGKTLFAEGFGYADLENQVPCRPETVFSIAGISKPITMAAVAKLWEQGLLDLDKPVQYYVPEFPEKTWNGEKVTITTRQLVSHISGIRHYQGYTVLDQDKGEIVVEHLPEIQPKHYDSVIEALEVFKDDPLVHKPGTRFDYSNFGWILISAIVERAAKMPFEEYMKTVFNDLGMKNTCFEKSGQTINNQARQYCLQQEMTHVPTEGNRSFTFGDDAMSSNVLDLLKFGNAMLYSYNSGSCHGDHSSGYLKSDTMKMLWTKLENADFGMGWNVKYKVPANTTIIKNREYPKHVGHLSCAYNGSACLFIIPGHIGDQPLNNALVDAKSTKQHIFPKGFVISILMNRNIWGCEPEDLFIIEKMNNTFLHGNIC